MKKVMIVLLALLAALSLAACNQQTPPPASASAPASSGAPPASSVEQTAPPSDTAEPVAEEVKGVTIPAFSVTVNEATITHEAMAAYPVYSVQATSVNSSGTESTVTYVGFAMSDVLAAAGLTEKYIWLEATATDGYAVTFNGDAIFADTTLLAVTKDGSPFSEAPWFAPCSDKVTGNYLKGVASILVNTVEGAPDIQAPKTESSSAAPAEGLPEILDRTDKVEFAPYTFKVNGQDVTNDTLEGLGIYKITAVTENSKGEVIESDYTGYRLSAVLEACGIKDYTTVKAVANDGYETQLDKEAADSDYTLVAIEKDKETGEDGTVWLAPCAEKSSKVYAKLVVEIKAE